MTNNNISIVSIDQLVCKVRLTGKKWFQNGWPKSDIGLSCAIIHA